MAGQFARDCPDAARDSASCWISCLDARTMHLRETRVRKRVERMPALSARAGLSGCHLPGFNRLEHGAEIVPMRLGQLDIALDREDREPFALRNHLGPLRKGPGQVAPGQVETQAAG